MARKKKKAPEAMAYGEAVEEIESILESIDRDEVDVDELSEKVERAVQLLGQCRDKLRVTDARVQEVLADVEKEAGEIESAGPPASQTAVGAASEPAAPAAPSSGGERPPIRDQDFAEEDDELPF